MKLLARTHIAVAIFLFINTVDLLQITAQNKSVSQKEQMALLKKADSDYLNYRYFEAAAKYENYLTSNKENRYVLSRLADCFWQHKDYDSAFGIYLHMFPNGNRGATKVQQLRIAEMYAREQSYSMAAEWLNGVDGYQDKAAGYKNAMILKSMKKDSLNWHLAFLNVNTSYQEFSPVKLDNTLIFSSNRPNRSKANIFEGIESGYDRLWEVPISEIQLIPINKLDIILKKSSSVKAHDSIPIRARIYEKPHFFYSHYKIGETDEAATLVKGLGKIPYNVGTVSVDKNNHYYFTTNYSNPDKVGVNRLRLVEAVYNKGSFKTKFLPFGNSERCSVMHSTVNSDGTLMIFSSDISGGKGGCDLYYVQRDNINKDWSKMKPLGANVNTKGNEVFPTLTTNGYLYFSSDALPGLGGLDIFRIPLHDALAGKGKPEHISYPVNSSGDDFGWSQDTTNADGYFTSDRLSHNNDLFSFSYKELLRMNYINNKVFNIDNNEPIDDATLFLLNKEDGKVYVAKTDKHGGYRFNVPDAKGVIVKVMKKGYSSFCLPAENVSISQPFDTVLKASNHFSQEKLKINYAWKLNVIYYGFDKSNLSPDAMPVLDSLIKILKKYPISIEICSHTDSRGTVDYNNQLSERRSKSVVDYLVEHGIKPSRLIAKGYGKSKLINRCANGVPCSEKEHQINRRTEVKVIDYEVEQKASFEEVDPDNFKQDDVFNLKAFPKGFFSECTKD